MWASCNTTYPPYRGTLLKCLPLVRQPASAHAGGLIAPNSSIILPAKNEFKKPSNTFCNPVTVKRVESRTDLGYNKVSLAGCHDHSAMPTFCRLRDVTGHIS